MKVIILLDIVKIPGYILFVLLHVAADKRRLQDLLTKMGEMSTKAALFNVDPAQSLLALNDPKWSEQIRESMETARKKQDIMGTNFILFTKQDVALKLLDIVGSSSKLVRSDFLSSSSRSNCKIHFTNAHSAGQSNRTLFIIDLLFCSFTTQQYLIQ